MKTFKLLLVFAVLFGSCKKEQSIVPVVGQSYGIRSDIFNKGTFQPIQPVLVMDLYIGPNGTPYAHCKAGIDWDHFAIKKTGGVADQTVEGNLLTWESLQLEGVKWGDSNTRIWEIPQFDLK